MTREEWLQEVRLGIVFDDALEAWDDEVTAARAAGYAEAMTRECAWRPYTDTYDGDWSGDGYKNCKHRDFSKPEVWCPTCGGKVRVVDQEGQGDGK